MTSKIQQIPVEQAAGYTINQTFFRHDDPLSEDLLIILPGRGYTTSAPLLWYLRKAATELRCDVLSVAYSFHVAMDKGKGKGKGSFGGMNLDSLNDEVTRSVDSMLAQQSYTRLFIAGKSLGTPLAVAQAKRLETVDALLLQTPILNCVADTGDIPTLAVIGTADAAYDRDTVAADKDRPHVKWLVYEGLDHGLEAGQDWQTSLERLKDITAACTDFLSAQMMV